MSLHNRCMWKQHGNPSFGSSDFQKYVLNYVIIMSMLFTSLLSTLWLSKRSLSPPGLWNLCAWKQRSRYCCQGSQIEKLPVTWGWHWGLTDCITDNTKFCADAIVPMREIKCFPSNKPWVTRLNDHWSAVFHFVLQTLFGKALIS